MPSRTATDPLEALRALAEPTRLEIVERLRKGECCVCELTDALDAAQSRLSFHLRVLKDAGILSDRKEGRWVYYELRPEALGELAEYLSRPVKAGTKCC